MIEFDEIEGIEQARQAEAEEERQRHEAAAQFAKVLELEAVVEARLQPQEAEVREGTQGVLISIQVKDFEYLKKWKATGVFFCDAMNTAINKLHKLLADKDRCEELGFQYIEGSIDTIAAFLNWAVQLRYHAGAAASCERLAECFQGERGVCALVHQGMEAATSERRRADIRKSLETLMCSIAENLLRLLMCVHWQSWDHRAWFANHWLELQQSICSDVTPATCLPLWLEHGWEVAPEDTMHALVHPEDAPELMRVLRVSKRWTLDSVRMVLELFCEAPGIQLLGPKDSSGVSVELSLEAQMESLPQPIVVRGMDPSAAGWRCVQLSSWPPEWASRWRHFVGRICKTTPLTATRLLCELRSKFTDRAFQEQYRALKRESRPGNKAHQEILSLTFNVQSKVLPRYGFEATPKGLMEMRDEMPIFAGLDVWCWSPWGLDQSDEVVWKVRRDIHAVLDMGQVLPRMQLNGAESLSGHKGWLRWAQLNAGVESGCAKAAELITQADVFLLCAGAGFSADSGLAVYADVAKVHAYAKRGLDYSDICSNKWLRTEPDLFWGFWGQCYNDYRDTAPHDGYRIVHRWVERRFRRSAAAEAVRQRLAEAAKGESAKSLASSMPPVEKQPYVVKDYAGAFMAFTSNVDAHLWDWFRACEIRECHGNTETYQCASLEGRCEGHWRAPFGYRFRVNTTTMLAPLGPADEASGGTAGSSASPGDDAPHVGHVRGGGRPNALQHMPDPVLTADKGFRTNHPKCPFCSGPSRPAILMFKDTDYRDNRPQAARWDAWVSAVKDVIKSRKDGEPLQVAVMEVGAGGNVTTVRKTSEQLVESFTDCGASARLIRVNPELPLGDGQRFGPGGDLEHLVVSIMNCALESIRRMDAAMPEAMREEE